jgi:hypothetical protein
VSKLPRLWDEKIPSGKRTTIQRYDVRFRRRAGSRFIVWDRLDKHVMPDVGWFQSRTGAENWLKKTTVRWYKLMRAKEALRMND